MKTLAHQPSEVRAAVEDFKREQRSRRFGFDVHDLLAAVDRLKEDHQLDPSLLEISKPQIAEAFKNLAELVHAMSK